MFKQLRNRLILLNVGILTILLLVIFGSLYISTYQDVHNRIDYELQRIIQVTNGPGGNQEPTDPDMRLEPIQSISFLLSIDDEENITAFTRVNFTADFFTEAYSLVDDDEGTITFDDQTWAYLTSEGTQGDTLIGFVNVTSDMDLLSSTLISYLIIFAISFSLVALISYFMTNRSIKPVKETFEKQKRFISDASHELKTPLTVINANVDVLLSQNTNKKDQKWLEYIQKEVVRMNKLTQNLLYLANVSNEEARFVKENVNISSDLESSLLGIEALAYEKEIKLHYDIKPELEVYFNKEQCTQAIMILLDNAIKYTPNKGTMNVSLRKSSNHVYLSVKNSGKGIPEKDIPRLFDRFYKVDESRQNKSDSYGLGLSILKAICDYNNTKINVSSVLNEFTEFELKIPTK